MEGMVAPTHLWEPMNADAVALYTHPLLVHSLHDLGA
jgi:hypothetical protein